MNSILRKTVFVALFVSASLMLASRSRQFIRHQQEDIYGFYVGEYYK